MKRINPRMSHRLNPLVKFAARAAILFLPAVPALAADVDAKAPDPEVERKTFTVADGFEVNLFAADPKIAKPIQMNFDPQGRLWVVSSSMYPQVRPGEEPHDK